MPHLPLSVAYSYQYATGIKVATVGSDSSAPTPPTTAVFTRRIISPKLIACNRSISAFLFIKVNRVRLTWYFYRNGFLFMLSKFSSERTIPHERQTPPSGRINATPPGVDIASGAYCRNCIFSDFHAIWTCGVLPAPNAFATYGKPRRPPSLSSFRRITMACRGNPVHGFKQERGISS